MSTFTINGDLSTIPPYIPRTGPLITTLPPQEQGRVIIIGDIHGCYEEFCELLEKCGYVQNLDRVILVGDLVNKGPFSDKVVTKARLEGFYSVKGNHDDFSLRQLEIRRKFRDQGKDPNTQSDPNMEWVDTLHPENETYLQNLPYIITIPQHNTIVVHAGLVPNIPLPQQPEGALYRIRDLVLRPTQGLPCFIPTENYVGKPWAECWKGPEFVLFGHDAQRGLQVRPMAIGLDSGCCYGAELTACILPKRELVQVKARRVYVTPKVKISKV